MKILAMGRRWGKTILGGSVALACSAKGASVAWVAPTYRNSRPLWRFVEGLVSPLSPNVKILRAEKMVIFPNGGRISIYSADSPDSIRGEAFDLVVIDEAARVAEHVWTDAIAPTLADRSGRAFLISTPAGKNWFWRAFVSADGNSVAAFRAPSCDNPNPNIQRAYELAKMSVPARTFAQEWDAQFVDDAGGVFANVRACARDVVPSNNIIIACDIGRDEDYTAVAIADTQNNAIIAVRRWRGMPYTETVRRISAIAREFHAREIVVESNAMGAPIADYLAAEDLPVSAVSTTRASKQAIIERLAAMLERKEIALPRDDYVLTELENYTAQRRADGTYAYSAPHGLHDDCVMAIAWAASRLGSTGDIADAIF